MSIMNTFRNLIDSEFLLNRLLPIIKALCDTLTHLQVVHCPQGERHLQPPLEVQAPEPSRALEPRLARLLLPHLAARPSASASPRCCCCCPPSTNQQSSYRLLQPLLLLSHSCLLSSLHPFKRNRLFRRWQVWTFSGQAATFQTKLRRAKCKCTNSHRSQNAVQFLVN